MRGNSTERSRAMKRAVSRRQQDRTSLNEQIQNRSLNSQRERDEGDQFSSCARCSERTQRDASQSAWTPNLPSSCSRIDKYIQNHAKIPWRESSKKLTGMSWKWNHSCIIIFKASSLKVTAPNLLSVVGVLNINPRKSLSALDWIWL